MTVSYTRFVLTVLGLLAVGVGARAQTTYSVQTLADDHLTGLSNFHYFPVINRTGAAAYYAHDDTAGRGRLYVQKLTDPAGSAVASDGGAALGLVGKLTLDNRYQRIGLSDEGRVAFRGLLGSQKGVFSAAPGVAPAFASALALQPLPGGDALTSPGFPGIAPLTGRIAVSASALIPNTSSAVSEVVSLGFAPGRLARSGQAAPGGGVFDLFGVANPSVNDTGRIAISVASGAPGVYAGKPGALQAIVKLGDLAPGGLAFSAFDPLFAPGMNAGGMVAFKARVGAESVRGSYWGVFVTRPTSRGWSLQRIAKTGDAAPQGGLFTGFSGGVSLNDNGDVAFLATTSDTRTAIYVRDSAALSCVVSTPLPWTGPYPIGPVGYTRLDLDKQALDNQRRVVFHYHLYGALTGGQAQVVWDSDGVAVAQPIP